MSNLNSLRQIVNQLIKKKSFEKFLERNGNGQPQINSPIMQHNHNNDGHFYHEPNSHAQSAILFSS